MHLFSNLFTVLFAFHDSLKRLPEKHMCLSAVNIVHRFHIQASVTDGLGKRDPNCLVCHWGNHWNTNKYLKNQNNSINKSGSFAQVNFDFRSANTCISIWKTDTKNQSKPIWSQNYKMEAPVIFSSFILAKNKMYFPLLQNFMNEK